MKAITSLVAGAALAASLVAGPAHASDLLNLRAKVKKYAATVDGAPRTLCVCREPTHFNDVGITSHTTPPTTQANRAGVVHYIKTAPTASTLRFAVRCDAPTFNDSDGSTSGSDGCGTFAILAK